jgi:hypothetical protein
MTIKVFMASILKLGMKMENDRMGCLLIQNVHSSHFLVHFDHCFCQTTKNDLKMKPKISQKWPKNGYCEQPYCFSDGGCVGVSM